MIGSLNLRYRYAEDGFSYTSVKIPDIPIAYLALTRRDGRRARGTAVIDTGFDGGLLPSRRLLEFFDGLQPAARERLGTIEATVECEVYRVKAALAAQRGLGGFELGEVNVYIPVEPEYVGDEVLIGREILNKLSIRLDGEYTEAEPSTFKSRGPG